MTNKQALLERLEAIGRSLAASGNALALIGLGSSGSETERLDVFSDLDFFVVVEAGSKARYLNDLDWLERIHPISFFFMNTVDGYKLLFEDGIFCEFAVFEPEELKNIPFSRGRLVWKREDVPEEIGEPAPARIPPVRQEKEFLVGEAVTNLYVGMGRYRRGEKLSAARFVQQYAVDRIVDLAPWLEAEKMVSKDEFGKERRFEQRFPLTAGKLSEFIQGYERTPESAEAILEFLQEHFEINAAMGRAVRELIRDS